MKPTKQITPYHNHRADEEDTLQAEQAAVGSLLWIAVICITLFIGCMWGWHTGYFFAKVQAERPAIEKGHK